ncbi:MAG: hypothetical protein ACRECL_06910 [Bradyrhizobium sp.]
MPDGTHLPEKQNQAGFSHSHRYPESMADGLWRIARLLLALTIMLGLIPHDLHAAGAHAGMVTATSVDVPMSGKCHGCADHDRAMAPAACPACYSNFVVLPVTGMLFEPLSADHMEYSVCPTLTGYTTPPDPYPPRRADPS